MTTVGERAVPPPAFGSSPAHLIVLEVLVGRPVKRVIVKGVRQTDEAVVADIERDRRGWWRCPAGHRQTEESGKRE